MQNMMNSAEYFEDSNQKIKRHRKNLLSLLSLKRSILEYEKSPSEKVIITQNCNFTKGSTINIKSEQANHSAKWKQSKTIHTDIPTATTSERHLEKKIRSEINQLTSKSSKIGARCKSKVSMKKQPEEKVELKSEINTKINALRTAQTAYELTKKATSNQVLTKENVQNRVNLFVEKYKSSYRMQQRKITIADKQHQQIEKLAAEISNKLKETNESFAEEEEHTLHHQPPIQNEEKAQLGSTQNERRGKSTLEIRPTIKARLEMKKQIQKKVLLKDRYQILQRIGRGLSGQVYKAKDILSDRIIAIKIITQSVKKQEQYEFYKTIQHNNIVSYYNNFVYNGNRYLVLEYFPYTLHRLCKTRRLEEEEIKKIFRGIANGLMFLHGLSIAHRDIKLDNIVVSEDLNEIKFIDFGLCIDLSKCENQKTRQFCGTILYMSPQILEKRAYNPKKADIWSLGILLYRLLFNRYPFNSRNEFLLLEKIKKTKIIKGESCNSNLSLLLEGMLNKNPSDRFTILDVMDNKWMN